MDKTNADKSGQVSNFLRKDLIKGLIAIYQNALEYKKLFFTSLVLSLVIAIVAPVDTLLFGYFIDSLGASSGGVWNIFGLEISLPIGILIVWLCLQVVDIILFKYRTLASRKLDELVRTSYLAKLAGHLFRLPLSFHKSKKMGEVQEKVTAAASSMGNMLSNDLMFATPQFISTFIILGILATLNIYLFILVAIIVVIYTYYTIITVRPTVPLEREVRVAYNKARGSMVDAILNIKIIKDFTAESYQTDQVLNSYQRVAMPVWYKLFKIRRNQSVVQDGLILFTRGIVLIASVYFVSKGQWTIGSMVIANSYLMQLFRPIRDLSANWRNIQNGIIAIQDTEDILALPTENYLPELKSTKREDDRLLGKVEFKNVSFSYSKEMPILKDVSFVANPGDVIALVGESGVGKSSLIDLISAYHFADQGEILIDDSPIKTIPLNMLRQHIGVVTQELILFNDTIKNNIRYGNFNCSDEDVLEAAHKAHCYDFIQKFPDKWEQLVGERGLRLSVGQKQRVAIARAILKNPQILILDEPTSALDASSERIITESLEELMKGKTTFIVAHRLSTVRRADKILVFKDGMIVESGTHEELLGKVGGEYRRLHELQSGVLVK